MVPWCPERGIFTWPPLSKHRPWGNLAVAEDVNHHTGDDSSLAFRYAAEQPPLEVVDVLVPQAAQLQV